jgi:hypothetical protein
LTEHTYIGHKPHTAHTPPTVYYSHTTHTPPFGPHGLGRCHAVLQRYPSLADFTQVNAQGERNVQPGEYTFKFGVKETAEHGSGYTEHKITTY